MYFWQICHHCFVKSTFLQSLTGVATVSKQKLEIEDIWINVTCCLYSSFHSCEHRAEYEHLSIHHCVIAKLSSMIIYWPYTGRLDPSTQQHRMFPGLRTLVCLERYLWLFSNHIVICFLLFVLFLSNNQQLVYWPFAGPLLVYWAFTDLEFYCVELTHWRGLKLPTWASWNLILGLCQEVYVLWKSRCVLMD